MQGIMSIQRQVSFTPASPIMNKSMYKNVANILRGQTAGGKMLVQAFAGGGDVKPYKPVDFSKLLQGGLSQDTRLAAVTPQEELLLKTVGGIGSLNPQGIPQYGFNPFKSIKKVFKSVKKVFKKIAPTVGAVVGFMIGGIPGAMIGSGLGTYYQTGDFETSLKAAAITGLTAGISQGLAAPLGLDPVRNAMMFGALSGGVGAALTGGDLKDVLKGAGIGALTGGAVRGVSNKMQGGSFVEGFMGDPNVAIQAGGNNVFYSKALKDAGIQNLEMFKASGLSPAEFSKMYQQSPAEAQFFVETFGKGAPDLLAMEGTVAAPSGTPQQIAEFIGQQQPAQITPATTTPSVTSVPTGSVTTTAADTSTTQLFDKVKIQDTTQLADLAEQYGGMSELQRLNPNVNFNQLMIGQEIVVPYQPTMFTQAKQFLDPRRQFGFEQDMPFISKLPFSPTKALGYTALMGYGTQVEEPVYVDPITGEQLLAQDPLKYGFPQGAFTPQYIQYNPLQSPYNYALNVANGGDINGPGTGISDSIPAMLSDGEFVFTAKAVRGAGNGDRELGVQNMYKMMNQLENYA